MKPVSRRSQKSGAMMPPWVRSMSSCRSQAHGEIIEWLERFSAAVRARDFDAGRALFAEGVTAFGTRADSMHGLAQLEAEQWQPTWRATRGYRFNFDAADIQVSSDFAYAAIPWHSEGVEPSGRTFDRFGRATYILRKIEGRWLAVHTHHSLNPNA